MRLALPSDFIGRPLSFVLQPLGGTHFKIYPLAPNATLKQRKLLLHSQNEQCMDIGDEPPALSTQNVQSVFCCAHNRNKLDFVSCIRKCTAELPCFAREGRGGGGGHFPLADDFLPASFTTGPLTLV